MESVNLFIFYMFHVFLMYYLMKLGVLGLEISREKRYQESNWVVKLSRRRHYLYIPFKWVYYQYFSKLGATDDTTGEVEYLKNRLLYRILIGEAQGDMKWYHTTEEVKENFKIK